MHSISNRWLRTLVAVVKGSWHGLVLVALGALAATALAAHAAPGSPAHSAAGRFGLSASPALQAVEAGTPARYQIAIWRQRFRGAIALSVSGMPRNAEPQLTNAGGSLQTLTVATSGHTPAGQYTFQVNATGGTFRAAIQLALKVSPAIAAPIGVAGSVTGLAPGLSMPLDLELRNHSRKYLWVLGLTVTTTGVSAPRATPQLPCTLADFSLRQYSGTFPLIVPPSGSRKLSALGASPSELPQVTLLNRPVDQDGCQGATVALNYAARGETP
jgi:hypothetical protein